MLAMHPARNATRWRVAPFAGKVLPIWLKKNGGSADGASCARSPRVPFAQAGVQVKGAAAALPGGHHHFAAVLLQHAHGGFVQAREGNVGNAPGEKRDAMAGRV